LEQSKSHRRKKVHAAVSSLYITDFWVSSPAYCQTKSGSTTEVQNMKPAAPRENGKDEQIKGKKKGKMSEKRPVTGEQILLRPSSLP